MKFVIYKKTQFDFNAMKNISFKKKQKILSINLVFIILDRNIE